MNAFESGDESVRKAHAPRKGGWDSVVTIAGKKAADAANAISEGRGGRANIENCQEGCRATGG